MGRQPWVVYGLLRTSDALSKNVVASQIVFSLVLFTLVYSTLFVLFLYLLNKKIKHGPLEVHNSVDPEGDQRVGAK
jgi:cytochrome d ubiquinol oxidase subunit I